MISNDFGVTLGGSKTGEVWGMWDEKIRKMASKREKKHKGILTKLGGRDGMGKIVGVNLVGF